MSTFLKLDDGKTNKFVSCDNVVSIAADTSGTGATEVVKVTIEHGFGSILTTVVSYAAPGTSNEYTGFTLDTLQSQFEDAIMEMQNPEAIPGRGNFTGFKLLNNIVGVKVTASGVLLANSIPTITTS
tara:strand:+ start:2011 stop:2391 length:381 start_codon:yes stop_codon:yes gene_type:complete